MAGKCPAALGAKRAAKLRQDVKTPFEALVGEFARPKRDQLR
jgi:hypothetical protein